ncbi:hypothetical protein FHW58_003402 [Duganella sp. 1224]|nr:hypothetical protein [Duganella sp. 1224]
MGQLWDGKEERVAVRKLDEVAAMFGLYIVTDDRAALEPQEFHLWPENVPAWNLFCKVLTQWNTDNGEPTGLNYPGVEVVMRKHRIKRSEELNMFNKIQAMEEATLKAWSEKRNG